MNPKVIQVIICYEPRGSGKDGDPYRSVTRIYTLDGDLLAEHDPWQQGQQERKPE